MISSLVRRLILCPSNGKAVENPPVPGYACLWEQWVCSCLCLYSRNISRAQALPRSPETLTCTCELCNVFLWYLSSPFCMCPLFSQTYGLLLSSLIWSWCCIICSRSFCNSNLDSFLRLFDSYLDFVILPDQ